VRGTPKGRQRRGIAGPVCRAKGQSMTRVKKFLIFDLPAFVVFLLCVTIVTTDIFEIRYVFLLWGMAILYQFVMMDITKYNYYNYFYGAVQVFGMFGLFTLFGLSFFN
jgi:hypothetical protein